MSRTSGTYKAGGLMGNFITDDTPDDALRLRLARLSPHHTAAGWFEATSDLWSTQVVFPALQSAVLGILATQRGLDMQESTTDRDGRPAVAISVETRRRGAERLALLLDPDTGALLGFEREALEPRDLPIRTPVTVGYTVWLATGYTTSTDEEP